MARCCDQCGKDISAASETFDLPVKRQDLFAKGWEHLTICTDCDDKVRKADLAEDVLDHATEWQKAGG